MVRPTSALDYFQSEYSTRAFEAQRRYPNEELCRFMGRTFFGLDPEDRARTRILEVGCGSGANLWMIAREGFDAVGLDLSAEGIYLCAQMLAAYEAKAELHVGSMTDLPFEDGTLDGIVDIFSSHCLTTDEGDQFLTDTQRCLKSGGWFFSYFPSSRSDSWSRAIGPTNGDPTHVDDRTLNGLHRADDPYVGNAHPFRFLHPVDYRALLARHGMTASYCETLTRTYRTGEERFEFVVIAAQKPI